MNPFPRELHRYLRQRQSSGPWTIQPGQSHTYDACIVIPALAESQSLPRTLKSLAKNEYEYLTRTMVLVVLNNRVDSDRQLIHDNAKSLQILQQFQSCGLNLAWIDAFSHGHELPTGQGVGLARKIGFDLCLSLLNWAADPFLVSLDADTLVSSNYLQTLFKHFAATKAGGAVIPFRHQPGEDKEQERAIRRYELFLRSYSYGLELAGSPYAYDSIGSALACRARSYIKAGGMNRRCAGEDFYFLQQLTKTVGISRVSGTLVFPSPRESERVPFGTGRTISSLVDEKIDSFSFCEKGAFLVLKEWLVLASSHWHDDSSELLKLSREIDNRLTSFLEKLNFSENWAQLQANHSQRERFQHAFHCWFDGLRSRQLLTCLDGTARDELEIINELLVWGGQNPQASVDKQLSLLETLRGITHEQPQA